MENKTTDKLARALEEAGALKWMIEAAFSGRYDDYKSDSATPIMDLIRDCRKYGLEDLAKRAMNGEFDASKEESEEWFEKEGKHLL